MISGKATAARRVSDQQITGVLTDTRIYICFTTGGICIIFNICSGLDQKQFQLGGGVVAQSILATLQSLISCFSHTLSP